MTKAEWLVIEAEIRNWPPVRAAAFRQRLRATRRPPTPAELGLQTFSVVRLAPKHPRPPPGRIVLCVPEKTLIPLTECIDRANAATASGAGKGYPVHEACRTCPLREEHRAMVPTYEPRRYRPFNVSRESKERAARQKAWREGRLGRVATQDDPPSGDEE